jgi:hypothetical protein
VDIPIIAEPEMVSRFFLTIAEFFSLMVSVAVNGGKRQGPRELRSEGSHKRMDNMCGKDATDTKAEQGDWPNPGRGGEGRERIQRKGGETCVRIEAEVE